MADSPQFIATETLREGSSLLTRRGRRNGRRVLAVCPRRECASAGSLERLDHE